MNIPIEHVRDIHTIAEALIVTLDRQAALLYIAEGNVVIDAAINCLCYAMKQSGGPLPDDELLKRVKKYSEALALDGAPKGQP